MALPAAGTHQGTYRMANRSTTKPPSLAKLARELKELIAAIDRRVPHIERAGEAKIARDAAALKARAVKRLATLEE